nr:family 43 glycosylhydrolase [Alistipes onderdonkii]
MFWGSFRGIWAIELADDGLSLKPGAGKRKIAGDQYEGTYIHKRDGYYYLIVSTGDFMKDYHVVVGRSRSLMGPYVRFVRGATMLGVHHELVVGNGNGFVAPGHNAEFINRRQGAGLGCSTTPGSRWAGRGTCCSTGSRWNDGWPEVRGHVPARSAEAPVFGVARRQGRVMSVRAAVHACDLSAMSMPAICLRHRGLTAAGAGVLPAGRENSGGIPHGFPPEFLRIGQPPPLDQNSEVKWKRMSLKFSCASASP